MTFFIQTLVINSKIFPSPLVLRTRGSWKILLLITRVCMKNVSFQISAQSDKKWPSYGLIRDSAALHGILQCYRVTVLYLN